MRNNLKILSDGTVCQEVTRNGAVLGFVRPRIVLVERKDCDHQHLTGEWVSIELSGAAYAIHATKADAIAALTKKGGRA